MTTASFTIPLPPSLNNIFFNLPPSLNNIFFNKPHGGRGKTTAYKNWREEAAWEIRRQRVPVIDGDVAVHLIIERPSALADIDNRIKASLDSIQAAGVIKNDNQVVEIHARWGEVKGATVLVSTIAASAAA